ncbi:MAG: peptide/nickel transport system ATP-binding protein [Clostridiales bacterium]|nr:peptide/nickel transport system ATP-binding protein [Clostridiales bacterium]
MAENILQFKDVTVEFKLRRGVLRAVDRVSFDVQRGEILGIVGESGSGKSTLASTVLNIVSAPGEISNGQIIYNGKDILKLSDEEVRKYRWSDVAMVFQAAQNSMNPVIRIKEQFLETAAAHNGDNISENDVIYKARRLMEYVRLEADQVLNSYPHQLSGGMKQRTIIAMSLLLDPKVLILDEPTTALDVITQAYIMDILRAIHADLGITMVFLTHDVSIMGKIADRMAVMYAGQVVELGTVDDVFYNSLHPYTKGLIHAAPSLTDDVSKRRPIPGSPPDLINPPEGCRFAPRCGFYNTGFCNGEEQGKLIEAKPGHFTTCLEWERMDA